MNKLNCVTLDGEQVNAKGALTGGYVDVSSSRLKYMKDLKQLQATMRQDRDDLKKTQTKIDGTELLWRWRNNSHT